LKAWWPVVVAVIVPGGGLIAVSVWLRRRWMAREAAAIDLALAIKREVLDAQAGWTGARRIPPGHVPKRTARPRPTSGAPPSRADRQR
jgi:hypothetical protein